MELWEQFESGKMFEDRFIKESIFMFKNNKKALEQLEPDDPQTLEEFQRLHNLAERKRLGWPVDIFRPREEKPPIQPRSESGVDIT